MPPPSAVAAVPAALAGDRGGRAGRPVTAGPPMAMLLEKTVWLISMLKPAKYRPPPIASPPVPPVPPAAPMAVLFEMVEWLISTLPPAA